MPQGLEIDIVRFNTASPEDVEKWKDVLAMMILDGWKILSSAASGDDLIVILQKGGK